MKLRNLNGAIRKNDGPVLVELPTIGGTMVAGLVKKDLMAALSDKFADGQTETGLTLIDGLLAIDRSVADMPAVWLNGHVDAVGADGVLREAPAQVAADAAQDDDPFTFLADDPTPAALPELELEDFL